MKNCNLISLSRALATLAAMGLLQQGCGNSGSSSPSANSPTTPTSLSTYPNTMTVNVGQMSICGQQGSNNSLCTSITVCTPHTTTCQTISDILVDTGSTGLRIFQSLLGNLTLSAEVNTTNGQPLAECATFGAGSDWGPIATAQIQLAGEPAVITPIQLINAQFASIPSTSGCSQPDANPTTAGFNGILGIGLQLQDCPGCDQTYFTCSGSTCTDSPVSASAALQNPVALLPSDNNGVVVELPAITSAVGQLSISGSVLFGIGTQTDNTPSGTSTYFATSENNSLGLPFNFNTIFNSVVYESIIDSGSTILFLPKSNSVAACPPNTSAAGLYCPSSTITLTATNVSANGTPKNNVNFQVANGNNLLKSNNQAFNNIAGPNSQTFFDWGLPFFYGRKIYIGFQTKASPIGTGPYWAY